MRDSGEPYVRVALLGPLTPGWWTLMQIMQALEGAFSAQDDINRRNAVKVELLLVNEGSRQRHWQPVAEQLVGLAGGSHPLVAVIGLGLSSGDSAARARELAARGMPMVAATATALEVGGLVRMSPAGDQVAAALRHSWPGPQPTQMIVYGDADDAYVTGMARSFETAWPGVQHFRGAGLAQASAVLCQTRSPAMLYSGRPPGLLKLVEAIRANCPARTITIGTGMADLSALVPQLHGTGVRILQATPDDMAMLHHDAFLAAATAINRVPTPNPQAVLAALRDVIVPGANGTTRFDSRGNPVGRRITVVQLPERVVVGEPYVTK